VLTKTISQKAAEVARQGGEVVKETLARMHAIAELVSQTSKKVHELGERRIKSDKSFSSSAISRTKRTCLR
jgi:methyl-accepting chemotaxis protein